MSTVRTLISERAAAGLSSGVAVNDLIVLPAGPLTTTTGTTASPAFSNSVIQETGVDEEDLIKTDGSMIYSLAYRYNTPTGTRTALQAHQRGADGVANKTASLDLAQDISVVGLHLAAEAKRIALVGSRFDSVRFGSPAVLIDSNPSVGAPSITLPPFQSGAHKVTVTVVDSSTPGSLPIRRNLAIDGTSIGTRRIGNMLYLITTWSPFLLADTLPSSATSAEREAALARLSTADILPTIQIDNAAPLPLVADTDCHVQTKNASLNVQITTITAIDLASPELRRNSRCFLGGNEAVYVSPQTVYIATTRFSYQTDPVTGLFIYSPEVSTDIHKFSLDALTINYKASGVVKGHLGWQPDKKPYRMSEFNGDLRVLTFTGATGWGATPVNVASPATLTILREQASAFATATLNPVSTLPNSKRPELLGLPNEQIFAVRFAGDRGYLVTFRQTDPLYVLDLSDPTDPKIVGTLKAPGFSDYLLPVGRDLLLGVGKDATAIGQVLGVKVGLIDVSDVQNPREISSRVIGQRGSTSALDYSSRGINLFTEGDVTRVALPILVNDGTARSFQGLHRFEVNARTKTLLERPYILATVFPPPGSVGDSALQNFNIVVERSVQIGAQVYYLTGGDVKTSNWLDGTNVAIQTIDRDAISGVTAAQTVVVRDATAWAALWATHKSNRVPPPPLPTIDFNRQAVAAVFLGPRNNGCFSVEVTNVFQFAATAIVEYRESVPQGPAICTQNIVTPAHFVAISASSSTVPFVRRYPPSLVIPLD